MVVVLSLLPSASVTTCLLVTERTFFPLKKALACQKLASRRTGRKTPEASCRPLSPKIILQESEQSEGSLSVLALPVK